MAHEIVKGTEEYKSYPNPGRCHFGPVPVDSFAVESITQSVGKLSPRHVLTDLHSDTFLGVAEFDIRRVYGVLVGCPPPELVDQRRGVRPLVT